MKFEASKDMASEVKKIIFTVYNALKEKGYDPINQIIGYILSGDPTYITSHRDARSIIRKVERDELLEEILSSYLEKEKYI
ncbi:MAG: IreB family regulatory phosphoprotein [Tissierellia bacterium]|nr:IreB family regulatory phosphoprotein [Tissierellia bacterium]